MRFSHGMFIDKKEAIKHFMITFMINTLILFVFIGMVAGFFGLIQMAGECDVAPKNKVELAEIKKPKDDKPIVSESIKSKTIIVKLTIDLKEEKDTEYILEQMEKMSNMLALHTDIDRINHVEVGKITGDGYEKIGEVIKNAR